MSNYPINDKRNPNYVQHQLIDNYLKSHPAAPDQGNRTSELDVVLINLCTDAKDHGSIQTFDDDFAEAKAALQRLISQEAARLADKSLEQLHEDFETWHHRDTDDEKTSDIMRYVAAPHVTKLRRRLDALQGGTHE